MFGSSSESENKLSQTAVARAFVCYRATSKWTVRNVMRQQVCR
ncbi:hypothetical protein GQ600_12663 [Phytophthora cactorum]|nr:hypothetical protein GQ600_12663 [Phytophthora cactorum]